MKPYPAFCLFVVACLAARGQSEAAAPATASFKFPTQTLTVPAGYTIELVAGPPLVNRPISLSFDELGRLYVTDSSGLSDKSDKQVVEKPHRVVRLTDTDGDGRFDQATVFADHMMFPEGALFYHGSLYVAAPPEIWKLTDADGDGIAERREVWYDGKTVTGCANDLHGPYLGPDGWFYFNKGAFAEQTHDLPGGRKLVTRASHIFRVRPDGSGLEPVLTGGMDNPVGLAFTATGERFLSGTFFQNPAAGKRDGVIHSVYGGFYGKENASAAGHPRTGDLMPIMTHMGAAAPCGATVLDAFGLGDAFAGNLLVCYFNLRSVVRHELVPDGATFTTRDHNLVTSDGIDFRPTDVLEDADGSLLVVDTGGWYKICCPTSALAKPDVLGAIYRLRRTGAPRLDDPRGLKLAWTTLTPAALAQLLTDPRPAVRQRAIDRLGQLGDAAVPALASALSAKSSVATRRLALWTLARIETDASRAVVREKLSDPDTSVRYVAAQVASLHRDTGALEKLTALLASPEPLLIRAAAEALGRLGDARAIDPLLAAVSRLADAKLAASGAPEASAPRTLEHALIYALLELDHRDELLARLGSAANAHVIRAVLVALDQMEHKGLEASHIAPLLESPNPILRQTAAWIAPQHPEWGGALAGVFTRRLAQLPASAAARSELHFQLVQLAKSPDIQSLLATTAADTKASLDTRRLALSVMAASSLKETPVSWLTALATALTTADLARDGVAVARTLTLPKPPHAALTAALARLGRDPAAPADVRLDALSALTADSLGVIDAGLFAFIQAQLAADRPLAVRSAAAAVLAKARLAPPQQLALADTLRSTGALEVPKLLPAFERAPNETLGLKLLAALKDSPGLGGVRANVLRALVAKYPASVQTAATPLLESLNADASRQAARLDELAAATKDGDASRGHAVFNSDKAACTLCHNIGYRGGRLGPDLTNIGRIRQPRELLEAIVFPSATFVRGYEPFTVATKSGTSQTGLIRGETADELLLATGPESEIRVARADIASITPGTVSPMPPGLDYVLSKQELADLLAFLQSRK